ncbi:hypothetical protein MSG28_015706 [Choristoneura fumiferana]|uniref:Uncharacterized protein n=1 Tax=Choristoneura fumiferana TaxID=7141 RepID=A0ACC0KBP5_CHOFU|nr:hypothetical protein MSG28_015706 [Choristoneura fumiferana]
MILNNLAQNPEINDQFSETTPNAIEKTDVTEPGHNSTNPDNNDFNGTEIKQNNTNDTRKHEVYHVYEVHEIEEPNIIVKLYNAIENAITKFLSSEKVMFVLHNIGTCVVNGVMDLITFYLPAPMIPLIASAAGMLVPFEPVVTLREKIPVTSYRRAFDRAVDSFMGTFDKYKTVDDIDDPYMTRRFNRRFMNDDSKRKKKNVL